MTGLPSFDEIILHAHLFAALFIVFAAGFVAGRTKIVIRRGGADVIYAKRPFEEARKFDEEFKRAGKEPTVPS